MKNYLLLSKKIKELNSKCNSLLDYIVSSIKNTFFCTFLNIYAVEEIMKSDSDLLYEYFHFKGNLSITGSNPALDYIIGRLIITNFINNAKYIDFIEPLLKEIHIPLKDVKEYSEKEVYKILKLLDNILFCQKTRRHCSCLFENIDIHLEKMLSILKERRKNKFNDKNFKESYITKLIQEYYKEYEILMNNYNKRKEYLKYFK